MKTEFLYTDEFSSLVRRLRREKILNTAALSRMRWNSHRGTLIVLAISMLAVAILAHGYGLRGFLIGLAFFAFLLYLDLHYNIRVFSKLGYLLAEGTRTQAKMISIEKRTSKGFVHIGWDLAYTYQVDSRSFTARYVFVPLYIIKDQGDVRDEIVIAYDPACPENSIPVLPRYEEMYQLRLGLKSAA